jgi:hypothetical protein
MPGRLGSFRSPLLRAFVECRPAPFRYRKTPILATVRIRHNKLPRCDIFWLV